MLFLISLLSFFLPTQLGLHLNNLSTTVYGFKIDYLTPTIYFTDVIIILIIIFGVRHIKFNFKFVALIIFAILNLLSSIYFIPSIYKWIKVFEMILLTLIILKNKKFDIFNNFVFPLSLSMIFVNILGVLQFFNKGSINGIFYWIGERAYRFSDPNVSPFPYSTFSHSNSYAGFLLVFVIFLIQYRNKFNIKYFLLSFCLSIINLILTNSQNVYLTIVLLIFIRYGKTAAFSLFALDMGARFITHRIELIKASFLMIKQNFWSGVGLNNFIINLPTVTNKFLNVWELQPVHNIYLLVFSETGIIGLLAFGYLLLSVLSIYSFPLIAVLISGLSDHYWLTLQQNILLLVFVVVTSKLNKSKHTV